MNKRKFFWLSSADKKNKDVLIELNTKLASFYSELATRQKYNTMIEGAKIDESLDEVTQSFLNWFKKQSFTEILEIGCGTGRIRKHLILKEDVKYTGTEMSEEVIDKNGIMWPDSEWYHKSVYNLDFPAESFDFVMSFYVLEHLVFPLKALEQMYNLTKPGGKIVVICPDFVESKRIGSQFIGLSFLKTAKEKIKKLKIIDAIVGLYDSRIRLTKAFASIKKSAGSFMINTNPICLYLPHDIEIWPDFDAVYLANKNEIEHWAVSKNMKVSYPYGKSGMFKEHVFIVLEK